MADPISQFQIKTLFPIAKVGQTDIVFTNSAAFMVAAVAITSIFLIAGASSRSLVPGRLQSMAELSYEFVANAIRSTAGSAGMMGYDSLTAPARELEARAKAGEIAETAALLSRLDAMCDLLVVPRALAASGLAEQPAQ